MAKQIRKNQETQERAAETEVVEHDEQQAKVAQEAGAAIVANLDELLDEIDDVLETNAEEFVKSYVQKGGQ